jgi:hypothetical protein
MVEGRLTWKEFKKAFLCDGRPNAAVRAALAQKHGRNSGGLLVTEE